jgi:hypothetical protein
MHNVNYRGAVRVEVTYKSGRKETHKFTSKAAALPTAQRLREMPTVAEVKMKPDGDR